MKLRTIQGILLGVVIGIAVGIGVYTFAYAKGWSYLTDHPAACANCHVMHEQFDGWLVVAARWRPAIAATPRQTSSASMPRRHRTVLAFILLHHGRLRGQYSDQTAQPGDHRASVPDVS